jgi:signal transduction histidine kinase
MVYRNLLEPADTAPAAETIAYARELRALYRSAEQRAVRFRLLVEMSRDLVNVRDTDALLRMALVRVTTFSGYNTGAVLLADAEANLVIRAALQIHAPTARVHLPNGVLEAAQHAFTTGTLILSPSNTPEAAQPPEQIYLPLQPNDGRTLGVLLLTEANTQSGPEADDLDALQLLTAQLAATLQNAQLYEAKHLLVQQLTEREARLAELVEQLIGAQEEERRRVAYEIHDGLAQMMLGVLQQLRTLTDRYKPRAPAARQALARSVDMAQATVEEARRVIAGLRPTVLDDVGLAQALQQLARSLQQDGRQVSYTATLGAARLPAALETALYRIAQEALTNVHKHAGPTPVALRLQRRSTDVILTVQDWGCGFSDPPQAAPQDAGTHVGLAGIRERVSLLNGHWRLESAPGRGTLLEVSLPLPSLHVGDTGHEQTAASHNATLPANHRR